MDQNLDLKSDQIQSGIGLNELNDVLRLQHCSDTIAKANTIYCFTAVNCSWCCNILQQQSRTSSLLDEVSKLEATFH